MAGLLDRERARLWGAAGEAAWLAAPASSGSCCSRAAASSGATSGASWETAAMARTEPSARAGMNGLVREAGVAVAHAAEPRPPAAVDLVELPSTVASLAVKNMSLGAAVGVAAGRAAEEEGGDLLRADGGQWSRAEGEPLTTERDGLLLQRSERGGVLCSLAT